MTEEFLKPVHPGDVAKIGTLLETDADLRDTRSAQGVHAAVLSLECGHPEAADWLRRHGALG